MNLRFSLSLNDLRLIIICLIIGFTNMRAQTYTYSVSGSGTADVNGVYIKGGTYNSHDFYTKISGTSNQMSIYFYSGYWTILPSISDQNTWYYYQSGSPVDPNPPTLVLRDYGWGTQGGGLGDGLNPPTTSQNTIANITFTDGSGFTPTGPSLPATNNPVGRFQLKGSSTGGVLQSVTISLSGTRSGVSNIKLWSSTSSTFNSSTATTLATNAADASSVTFSSFNSLVDNSTGTYYFVTVNLSAGASGSVSVTIPSQASFTFVGANNPSSFTNAALSSGTAPLPVELISFTAQPNGGEIKLTWQTATEVNNYGFNVERASTLLDKDWKTIGFVNGHVNSNSPKEYSFVDKPNGGLKFFYRLKQIDFDGSFSYSNIVEVLLTPQVNELLQNYPNPFNPTTAIRYKLEQRGYAILKVYDILGNETVTLIDGMHDAGSYTIQFSADRYGLSSGVYFYKLTVNDFVVTRKMIFIK